MMLLSREESAPGNADGNVGLVVVVGIENAEAGFGFDGNLYGQNVSVYPKRFLRDIKKYADKEELKTQIEDLRQYKTSIISEAVTGKVDLRGWKPK